MVMKRAENRTGLYVHEVRVTEEVVRVLPSSPPFLPKHARHGAAPEPTPI